MISKVQYFLVFRLFTTIGMQMKMTIISFYLYQVSHEALSLGMLGLFEALPRIAMSLPAGYFVERMEKRKALLIVVISYFILSCMLLMTILLLEDKQYVPTILYFIVFLMGIVGSMGPAASTTMFSSIIPREKLTQYSAISSNAWQLGAVIGPILAGFLIYKIGVPYSMIIVLITLTVSIIAIFHLDRLPSTTRQALNFFHSIDQIKEGLHFVFNHKILLWAISLDLFAVLFGGAVALLPIYAQDILQVGSQGYGIMRAATPLGSALAMLILATKPIKYHTGKWLLGSVAMFGLFTILFGISTHIVWALVCLFMIGMFDAVSVVIRSTLMIMETPEEIRARVSSVNSMFISSSNEIGAFESGFAAHYLGTVRSVVFGGCMTIFFVSAAFFKAKELLNFEFEQSKS